MSTPTPQDRPAGANRHGVSHPGTFDDLLLNGALSGLTSAVDGLDAEELDARAVVDAAERLHAQIQKCLEETTR